MASGRTGIARNHNVRGLDPYVDSSIARTCGSIRSQADEVAGDESVGSLWIPDCNALPAVPGDDVIQNLIRASAAADLDTTSPVTPVSEVTSCPGPVLPLACRAPNAGKVGQVNGAIGREGWREVQSKTSTARGSRA